MSVRSTTASAFQADVLESELPVLVDFWAPWCPPCRAVGPVLDELAAEQAGKVNVIKVNVDDAPELAQKYSVTSIPAFRVFKDGAVVDSFLGAMPKKALEARLAPYLDAVARR